jgi:hypothetical protein
METAAISRMFRWFLTGEPNDARDCTATDPSIGGLRRNVSSNSVCIMIVAVRHMLDVPSHQFFSPVSRSVPMTLWTMVSSPTNTIRFPSRSHYHPTPSDNERRWLPSGTSTGGQRQRRRHDPPTPCRGNPCPHGAQHHNASSYSYRSKPTDDVHERKSLRSDNPSPKPCFIHL